MSPAHFQACLVALPKDSPAKDFGSLVHLLLLQPHLVGQELAVYPGVGAALGEIDGRLAHRFFDEPAERSAPVGRLGNLGSQAPRLRECGFVDGEPVGVPGQERRPRLQHHPGDRPMAAVLARQEWRLGLGLEAVEEG